MYDWASAMTRDDSDVREAERELARRRASEDGRGRRRENGAAGRLRAAGARPRTTGA